MSQASDSKEGRTRTTTRTLLSCPVFGTRLVGVPNLESPGVPPRGVLLSLPVMARPGVPTFGLDISLYRPGPRNAIAAGDLQLRNNAPTLLQS